MPRKRNARLTSGFGRIRIREGFFGLTESLRMNVDETASATNAVLARFTSWILREFVEDNVC